MSLKDDETSSNAGKKRSLKQNKEQRELAETKPKRVRSHKQHRKEPQSLRTTPRILSLVKAAHGSEHQSKSETIPLDAKKPPPPPSVQETQQNKPDSTSKPCEPSGANTATAVAKSNSISKRDVGTAANILVELTLAPVQPTRNIYPIGTPTKKYFQRFMGWFQGTIRSYNKETKLYSVDYEDNDAEELEHHEIDTKSLPPSKYDIGTKYDAYFWSKESGQKMGWFVGTIQSKFYHDPNYGNESRRSSRTGRREWRYTVLYSDGDSEEVNEARIARYINKAKQMKKPDAKAKQMDSNPKNDDSLLDNTSNSLIEQVKSDEESSTSSETGDPNPEKIPYWTGKQHHQFILGLKQYGLGNLEEIHEANCIPSRSFRELVRYWHWYVGDIEEKGLVLNYEAIGTLNGKKGRRTTIHNDATGEEKKEETDKNLNIEPKKESKGETKSEGFHTGKWTKEEVEMVAQALAYHGHTYQAMSDFMKTRSPEQIASYYNRNKRKIQVLSYKYTGKASATIRAESKGGGKALSPAEHDILVEALAIYGHEYKRVESYMKYRTVKEIQGYVKQKRKALNQEVEDRKRLFKKRFPDKTHAWTCCELSRLVEGVALFKDDFECIANYVKTRNEDQVTKILEANPSQYEDESAFDLGGQFAFAIELYHVLNIAPFEGFCNIISWSEKGDFVIIHDKDQFANVVFPRFSYKGTAVEIFYKNLELFGFQHQTTKKGKEIAGTYHHPSFQKEDYRKVEHFCRKAFK